MEEERDVEVFERIPWESLEQKPDHRWMAYLLAGVLVLGAIGISLGRQMTPPPTSLPAPTVPATSVTAPVVNPTTVTMPATPEPEATWSEADLMALPASSLELSAAALAEWFVVEYFTREEPGGSRSYVDWAGASEVEWTGQSQAEVTVLVRRLAAAAGEPYQRLEPEAWRVTTDLRDDGWSVMGGPIQTDPPEWQIPDDPTGVEWVDEAGVSWIVDEAAEPER